MIENFMNAKIKRIRHIQNEQGESQWHRFTNGKKRSKIGQPIADPTSQIQRQTRRLKTISRIKLEFIITFCFPPAAAARSKQGVRGHRCHASQKRYHRQDPRLAFPKPQRRPELRTDLQHWASRHTLER